MPPSVLGAATLETLVSAAVAAPSMHNTQPWCYRLDPETTTLEVRAVPERGLRHADPAGRALHLSAGASLFNLRIAVAHFGWEPVVRLLPRSAEPDLLATVRVGPATSRFTCRRGDLYHAIWQRHSSRFPFSGTRLPSSVLTELREAAHIEGATLRIPDTDETERLLRVTAEAESRNAQDAERRAESRRWIRDSGPYGLSAAALGPQDATGHLPVRDFSGTRPTTRLPASVFERRPTIAVLGTAHDRRVDWMRAGQALQHVLLVATAHSVRASLLHQALEWPDLRGVLRSPRQGSDHIQMLIRLGYGQPGPPTARQSARLALSSSSPSLSSARRTPVSRAERRQPDTARGE